MGCGSRKRKAHHNSVLRAPEKVVLLQEVKVLRGQVGGDHDRHREEVEVKAQVPARRAAELDERVVLPLDLLLVIDNELEIPTSSRMTPS